MKIYYEKDVNMDVLKDKTVAVIGYGSQGRAQAMNMAESGLNVVVGLRPDGGSWKVAEEDGLEVMTVDEASRNLTSSICSYLMKYKPKYLNNP